jgi:hypothetical protein
VDIPSHRNANVAQPSNNVPSEEANTAARLAVLEERTASLADKSRAWYKNPSALISFAALIASFVNFAYTGYYTSHRDATKDKDQQKSDQQSAVVQLNALTGQWAELYLKYKANPDYVTFVNPAMKAQMALIGTKAYTLLNALGAETSALDSAVVANALEQTGDYATATKALVSALPHVKNPAEHVVIYRMLGQLSFYRNNIDDGNKYFGIAESVAKVFPNMLNQIETDYSIAETEAYWAVAASSQNHCESVKPHVVKINQYITTLPVGGQANQSFLTQLLEQVWTMCPNERTMSPPAVVAQPLTQTFGVSPPSQTDSAARPASAAQARTQSFETSPPLQSDLASRPPTAAQAQTQSFGMSPSRQ